MPLTSDLEMFFFNAPDRPELSRFATTEMHGHVYRIPDLQVVGRVEVSKR
jgi:hypothetical protein